MDKAFEVIDHTADTGIIAYGSSIEEAFSNAAVGLFNLITDLDNIHENLQRDLELSSQDNESLLVEWLNELIYLFDTENTIFKRFDITRLDNTQLKARSYGEKVDKSKHKLKTGVKATSYHMLKVEKDNGCKVQVLFDI